MAGKPVEVPVRPGNDPEHGAPTERPGAQEQDSNLSQAALDADQQASIAQSSGQAERVTVRGDQRQVVRDYFAQLNGRTNP